MNLPQTHARGLPAYRGLLIIVDNVFIVIKELAFDPYFVLRQPASVSGELRVRYQTSSLKI
jgi:hypothetical protein